MSKNNQNKGKTYFWQKIVLIIFGLFVTIIILEAGLRLGEFVFLSLQEYRNRLTIKQKGTYRIMCLGESTTALGGNDSYPFQLEEILNQRNKTIKFSVINKGIPGTDTSAIVSQLEDNLNRYNPDMVIAMMGINDGCVKHIPAKGSSPLKLRYLKTYNLIRLLSMHIAAKIRETTNKFTGQFPPPMLQLYGKYTSGENSGEIEKLHSDSQYKINDIIEYVKLGWYYKRQGQFAQSIEAFKKVIESDPRNEDAFVGLGYAYLELRDFPKMEESLRKAIEINPKNDSTHVFLGQMCNCCLEKLFEAESLFKKALEINPRNEEAYLELGWFYYKRGMPTQSIEMFKKAIQLDSLDERAYGALAIIYKENGKRNTSEEYYEKIKELKLGYYNSTIHDDYQKLKRILDKRGIKLICVQYPMRSIEPLKEIFMEQEGVIFVNNENIFKEALKKDSYEKYFTDMFGGNFGHCTRKGNRLLAKNIAKVILKEVLGQ